MSNVNRKAAAAAAAGVVGLMLLAFTAGSSFAQTPPGLRPGQGPAAAAPTHAQMDQMMEGVHGKDSARQMHEMMGSGDAQRGEQLMEQCVAMMGMMQGMQGMMGGTGGAGMMGGQSGGSMQDAMRRMMGQ